MANYESVARSNYFRVKNVYAFREWAKRLNLRVIRNAGRYAVIPDCGTWPGYMMVATAEGEEEKDIDFVQELATHLAPKSVAVLMEAGSERCRYIAGCAEAVDNTGKVCSLNLQSIYTIAKNAFPGKIVTLAEY